DGWINDSAGLYRTGRGYGWILDDANNVVFGGNLASPAHTYLANTMVWPRFEELRYRIDVPAGNYQLLLCNVNSNVKPAHFVIFNGDTLIKNKPERDRGCWTTSRVTVSGDSGLHFYLHGALSYLVLISDDGAPLSMVANDSSFGVITAPPSTPYEEEKSNVLLTRVVKATPNPFNPITKISFNAAANEAGVYSVYNMRGQLIRSFIFKNRENGPALITFTWDSRDKFGRNIASGIYTGILKTKGRKFTHTMVLVR
ncbi:MAG: T9SS type A sorting domain-containing protein, partial [Fibrobacteres bacterium]|nr:T9SS type A sorting domain-containing protein [Fibrobacterota bacterium]